MNNISNYRSKKVMNNINIINIWRKKVLNKVMNTLFIIN